MDKDVEVSRDQNTVVVEGIRYAAKPAYGMGCLPCSVLVNHGRTHCSLIPCNRVERHDDTNVYLIQL